jgi:cystathionine gamma-synthase/cystathionine gamma-lyase
MRFSTRAIHVGQGADPATGATVIPIHMSTTFTQDEIGKHKGFEYARLGNPTRAALEECIAGLEGGAHGLAFSSGMAATTAVMAQLNQGDHVVVVGHLYGGAHLLFERYFRPHGVEFTYVEPGNLQHIVDAMRPDTRLTWVETPTNPLLAITDIAAVGRLCRENSSILVVDNSYATPFLQTPLELGAHIVLHSTTKYLGGHSDVLGGAIVTSDTGLFESLRYAQNAGGAVPSPFDCWLVLRGIKTLAVRMGRHSTSAMRIAEYLSGHQNVRTVNYPGLATHPQINLARRQMRGFGGILSFEVKNGKDTVNAFVKRLKVFQFAEGLGGVESLASYPMDMSHGSMPRDELLRSGISAGLIRLSVGLEDAEDLVEDLDQALDF